MKQKILAPNSPSLIRKQQESDLRSEALNGFIIALRDQNKRLKLLFYAFGLLFMSLTLNSLMLLGNIMPVVK